MIGYVVRRLAQAVVVLFFVSIVVFGLLHALPGGLVRAQLGPRATTYEVHELTVQEGLNKPIVVQYGIWAWHALQGNLGFSYKLDESVGSLLARYLPRTLLLVGTSMVLAIIIAIPMGLWQAYRRNRPDDHALSALMLTFYSMPSFLIGVVLIVVLNMWLGVLPSTASSFGTGLGTDAKVLVLPVLALALGNVSYFSRFMRSSAVDNLLADHVRTAQAKGASPRRVLFRHVLRNSLTSTVTMIGLTLPYVISGSLIIEALFNFPGMGLLFWDAAQQRDYPVLLGVVLVVTVATVVGNLLADLGYAALDPRIRY
ncbi:ABC transporter permease [Aciditerrimonas ferrireducens]|uniref:ABC transporter permease n=1 Tax=Aciditerrimonas ferrireducens TaxID=667306 RepID=A0ABV6C310_9ACTN|nr:ABC transporter permease [Aciditerrimonas ferrireducens]MCK4176886.1 ABC transporter permease [Aciditerrimonas ferrireducens]